MKDFIDFIGETANNASLAVSFIDDLKVAQKREDVQAWFKSKGYDISKEDSIKIINMKDSIISASTQPQPNY